MGGAQTKEADGSVVLITGCSDGGIGSSLAVEFAAAGCHVVATARSLSSMTQLNIYPGIRTMELDVTDLDSVKAVVLSIEQENGRIDILVNNAGIPCIAPVAELPLTNLENAFRTNVFAPIALVQAVFPGMAARGKGKIVNVGSITSYSYGPWAGGYISSKAAMEALTDALRMECKPFGLQVMLVLPGAITSNIGKKSEAMTVSSVVEGLHFYKSWRAVLSKRGGLSQGSHSTSTQDFAQKIVEKGWNPGLKTLHIDSKDDFNACYDSTCQVVATLALVKSIQGSGLRHLSKWEDNLHKTQAFIADADV